MVSILVSRLESRHFGLGNGLETSLVTLYSVTFWSQNGLETGSRPFWSRKWSRDLVSSLSVVESQRVRVGLQVVKWVAESESEAAGSDVGG